MNRFASYGLIALMFQVGYSGSLRAEPAIPRVIFEEAKFDGVWWKTGQLKLEKGGIEIPELKASPKTENKVERKMSELDMMFKSFRVMSASA